jgi:hypothetical protein
MSGASVLPSAGLSGVLRLTQHQRSVDGYAASAVCCRCRGSVGGGRFTDGGASSLVIRSSGNQQSRALNLGIDHKEFNSETEVHRTWLAQWAPSTRWDAINLVPEVRRIPAR